MCTCTQKLCIVKGVNHTALLHETIHIAYIELLKNRRFSIGFFLLCSLTEIFNELNLIMFYLMNTYVQLMLLLTKHIYKQVRK